MVCVEMHVNVTSARCQHALVSGHMRVQFCLCVVAALVCAMGQAHAPPLSMRGVVTKETPQAQHPGVLPLTHVETNAQQHTVPSETPTPDLGFKVLRKPLNDQVHKRLFNAVFIFVAATGVTLVVASVLVLVARVCVRATQSAKAAFKTWKREATKQE